MGHDETHERGSMGIVILIVVLIIATLGGLITVGLGAIFVARSSAAREEAYLERARAQEAERMALVAQWSREQASANDQRAASNHDNASGEGAGAPPAHARNKAALATQLEMPGTRLPGRYSIPVVDISGDKERQVIVDREAGQYLGHPTTVLLEDNKTMLIVYPKGHGRGAIVYKRSQDAGLTWSDRLPTPKSWETSLEVPTLHRTIDASGKKRIIMFSGLYPIRLAFTEDDGATWSELQPIGDFGGVVTMATVLELKSPGHYLAFFHDDGRFIRGGQMEKYRIKSPHVPDYSSPAAKPWQFWVYTTLSQDGGLTWSVPVPIAMLPGIDLCEPGVLRSPDGKQIAVLLRENSRTRNSFVIFSDDEGLSWSLPRELPAALTGDRHVAKYTPDGRLFITFRDTTHESPTKGDWVGWVGKYDDIVNGTEGQYRVRIMDNTKGQDCAYPGVEVLPDETIVTTTYGHWTEGEAPYIVSVRFKLGELDAKAR